jgi:hypothetical protein
MHFWSVYDECSCSYTPHLFLQLLDGQTAGLAWLRTITMETCVRARMLELSNDVYMRKT